MTYAGAAKGSGSAVGTVMYLKEGKLKELKVSGARMTAAYLSKQLGDQQIFENVQGRLAEDLGLTMGLTMRQWEDIHAGRWGDHRAKMGRRDLREPDPDAPGKMRYRTDPATGKRLSEPYRTPYISLVISLSKDQSLAVAAAHKIDPQLARDMVADFTAAQTSVMEAVQRQAKLARVPKEEAARMMAMAVGQPPPPQAEEGAKKSHQTRRVPGADIMDIIEIQFSGRPTDKSLDREDQMSDLHIHAHHTIPTLCKVNGRWLTLDSHDLFTKRITELAAQTSEAETTRRWAERGIKMEFVKDRWGRRTAVFPHITRAAIRDQSTNHERTDEVAKAFADEQGRPPTQQELAVAMSATRKGKLKKDTFDSELDMPRVLRHFERTGIDLGYIEVGHTPERDLAAAEATLRERLFEPDGLTRDGATFKGEDIETAIARCSVELNLTPDERLAFEMDLRSELIMTIGFDDNGDMFDAYTTPAQWSREARVNEALDSLVSKQTTATTPNEKMVKYAVNKGSLERSLPYTSEQQNLIRALTSPQLLVVVEGEAGTMKTTIAHDAVVAERSANDKVNVLCVSTSRRTAIDSGAKIEADRSYSFEALEYALIPKPPTRAQWVTVKHLMGPPERRLMSPEQVPESMWKPSVRVDKDTIIYVDESAMVDTDRMDKFLQSVGKTGARVRLIGDPHQLQPIGPGGWYQDFTEKHPDSVVRVSKVMRQTDERDVVAARNIRKGNAKAAIEYLDSRGRIHIAEDASYRVKEVTDWYSDLRDRGIDDSDVQVIVDGANSYLDRLNYQIQRDRLGRGEIGKDGKVLTIQDHEQGRTWSLRTNDRILMLEGYGEGKHRIANGESGRILQMWPEKNSVLVEIGREKRVARIDLDPDAHHQIIGLAYAVGNHKFQGGEARFVAGVPSEGSDKWAGYTKFTRAKEEFHLFLDRATHGGPDQTADPRWVISQLWSQAPANKSAHRVIDEGFRHKFAPTDPQPSPDGNPLQSNGAAATTTVRREEPDTQRYCEWLTEHTDASFADAVKTSPAWLTLKDRLSAAEGRGENAKLMLFESIDKRPIDDADDIAALLSWRFDRAVPRSAEDHQLEPEIIEPRGAEPEAEPSTDEQQPLPTDSKSRAQQLREHLAERGHAAAKALSESRAKEKILGKLGWSTEYRHPNIEGLLEDIEQEQSVQRQQTRAHARINHAAHERVEKHIAEQDWLNAHMEAKATQDKETADPFAYADDKIKQPDVKQTPDDLTRPQPSVKSDDTSWVREAPEYDEWEIVDAELVGETPNDRLTAPKLGGQVQEKAPDVQPTPVKPSQDPDMLPVPDDLPVQEDIEVPDYEPAPLTVEDSQAWGRDRAERPSRRMGDRQDGLTWQERRDLNQGYDRGIGH